MTKMMLPIGAHSRRNVDGRPWNYSGKIFTAMIQLPPDFLDFLKLLNLQNVKYLLIGGYAVAHYGYVRATGDMEVFVDRTLANANRSRTKRLRGGTKTSWI